MSTMNKEYIVYKHTSPSNKVYIGITSRTIEERSGGKGCQYYKNKNSGFSNAIKKYGWSNFKHEILMSGLTQEEATKQEQYFIHLYNSNDRRFGYNLTSGGEKHFEMNKDIKSILSQKAKAQWKDPNIRAKMIEKLSSSHKGVSTEKMRKRYELMKDKTEKKKLILRIAHIIKKSIKEPKHLTDEEKKIISIKTKEGMNNDLVKAKIIANNHKRKGKSFKHYIAQYDLNNNIIKIHRGVANASRELNISPMSIHNCLRGKAKTSGGYVWKIIPKEEYVNGII